MSESANAGHAPAQADQGHGAAPPSPVGRLRERLASFEIKKPDPDVRRDLKHGFLLPAVLGFDSVCWGRWDYWTRLQLSGELPAEPIPPIGFLDAAHDRTRKMMETSLDCIPRHGSWQGMGGWEYVNYFLDWALFGLGHRGQPDEPNEPHGCKGASMRLYQVFNANALQLWPYDYLGDMLAESHWGRGNGFYPTPLAICKMMAAMSFGEGGDHRAETFCDPCLGTGRFPLVASNHTLRIYGMDIDATLIKATLFNSFLYAPWIVRPIAWLDRPNLDPEESGAISDLMCEQAPPQAEGYLAGTEHDGEEQWRFEPIKKRRRKTAVGADPQETVLQGTMF